MRRYLTRKILTYLLAFFIGVTIDWGIPRLMPGDPIQAMLSKFSLQSATYTAQYNLFAKTFGTNLPLWQQYLNYWKGMFTGNLGLIPRGRCIGLVTSTVPYATRLPSRASGMEGGSRGR